MAFGPLQLHTAVASLKMCPRCPQPPNPVPLGVTPTSHEYFVFRVNASRHPLDLGFLMPLSLGDACKNHDTAGASRVPSAHRGLSPALGAPDAPGLRNRHSPLSGLETERAGPEESVTLMVWKELENQGQASRDAAGILPLPGVRAGFPARGASAEGDQTVCAARVCRTSAGSFARNKPCFLKDFLMNFIYMSFLGVMEDKGSLHFQVWEALGCSAARLLRAFNVFQDI